MEAERGLQPLTPASARGARGPVAVPRLDFGMSRTAADSGREFLPRM